jgi:hypothetical protein
MAKRKGPSKAKKKAAKRAEERAAQRADAKMWAERNRKRIEKRTKQFIVTDRSTGNVSISDTDKFRAQFLKYSRRHRIGGHIPGTVSGGLPSLEKRR